MSIRPTAPRQQRCSRSTGLDTVIRKLIEMRYERAFRQSLMASAVRVGPEQLPALWSSWEDAAATLDLPGSHDVYVTHFPVANAAAVGSGRPIVVVNSAAISLFDEQELQTVLAHEAGHIFSDHVLYQDCASDHAPAAASRRSRACR